MFLIDSSNCKGSNYFFYLQIKLFQSILFIFQISDNPQYDKFFVHCLILNKKGGNSAASPCLTMAVYV